MKTQLQIVMLAFSLTATTAHGGEFRNGSFELLHPEAAHLVPDLGSLVYSNEVLGWTSTGRVFWPSCGRVSRPVDGTHYLILEPQAMVSQTFCTTTGELYSITFHVGHFGTPETEYFLTAIVMEEAGETLISHAARLAPSTQYGFIQGGPTIYFTARTTNTTLSFQNTNTTAFVGLDAVSVVSPSQPLVVGLPSYPVVEIRGPVDRYAIEFTESLGDDGSWKVLSVLTTPTSPYLFVDTSTRLSRQRFYRLQRVPCDQ